MTVDWVHGEFSIERGIALKKYQEFVRAGMEEGSIWTSVKGQILLGKEDFVERLIEHVRKQEEIRDLPRSQRYINMPSLAKVFNAEVKKDRQMRNQKISNSFYEEFNSINRNIIIQKMLINLQLSLLYYLILI